MLIDFLLLLPVTVFLLWLYVYSGPRGLGGADWLVDRLPAALALVASVAALSGIHLWASFEGLTLNVIAVVSAYLVLLFGLGLSWLLRWLRARR